MTTTSLKQATGYVIHALPEGVLAEARAQPSGGKGSVRDVVATGGEPLRCCLRDAGAGERLVLFNYRPPLPAPSPYREAGAVFAHAEADHCQRAEPTRHYPEAWLGRRQVLRAYDARGFIHPSSRVHDGTDPERVIGEILDEPDVVLVHSRNVTYGCFMFAVERG